MKRIEDAMEGWEKDTLNPSLKNRPERVAHVKNSSGIEIKRLYAPLDLEDMNYERDLGYPGRFPYTRGIHPTMFRGRLWTMRLFSGYATAEETNRRYRYLLEQGQTGLSVAFDMPTLMGYDSDSERAMGEVGQCGVAIDTLADMEDLFAGIPLDRVSTSMTINGPAAILYAMYIAVGEKQGAHPSKLRGTIQNDILKEYIAQKSWIFPPRPSMRIITDIFAYSAENVPQWNTISISGYHIREAGSSAAQELAFTLADGFAYVEAGIEAGMDVDAFAPRLSFFFDVHNDFFEEIAKFRAARRIWAREMKERFGAKDPRSWTLRCHAQTAGCSLTAQQPENNVVRVALQALAAVLGGTQSLHTNAMDEVLALPTEEAARVALRTQQIIAHETGVTDTVDPLAGSYYMEALTNELERRAYEYFEKIEALGGMIPAIEKGFPQREIINTAYDYQEKVDKGERIIVGVNEFVVDEPPAIPILSVGKEAEEKQKARLRAVRERRDQRRVEERLEGLSNAASGGENLMPHILAAVKDYASEGEIVSTLKRVFGVYQEPVMF